MSGIPKRVPGWMALVAVIAAASCGRTTPAGPTPAGPSAPPPSRAQTGTVTDVLSGARLSGVGVDVDGVGAATTGADGTFAVSAPDTVAERAVRLTAAAIVPRVTRMRVPGEPASLTAIPAAFNLAAFDQMFRLTGRLQRWASPPRLVLERRVLQFTTVSADDYPTTGDTISDATAAQIIDHLTWALPQLSGGLFTAFASVSQQTSGQGSAVRVTRADEVVVAHIQGLQAATTFWGWGRWASDAEGVVRGGIILMDRGFETSGSPFLRSARAHELGHALGYGHVTATSSVMSASARIEPTAFDRDASMVAFGREPGSRSPDIDPDRVLANTAPRLLQWTRGLP